jgi:hypothetical protein
VVQRIVVNVVLVAFAVLIPVSSAAPGETAPPAVLAGWLDRFPPDAEVIAQIDRYSQEEENLGPGYAAAIAASLRSLIVTAAAKALADPAAAPVEPAIDVLFPDAGFADPDGREPDRKSQRKFEEGFIRTEALVFLKTGDATPGEALHAYTDPAFRMEMSSRIKRIWDEDSLSCVEVKGITGLLSPTLGCNRVRELVLPDLAAQHSQVVSNPGGDDYQTIYYKESLKTFVSVPGGLVLHYINYTRAVKLGSIKRKIGGGKIADKEERKIRELPGRLSNGNP